MSEALAELWIEGVTARLDDPPPESTDVAHRLEQGFSSARARHPEISVSDEDLVMYALARTEATVPFDAARMADLLLACGLSRGDASALRTFDGEIVAKIRPALERLRLGRSEVDESIQRLRIDLFVGSGGEESSPRIAQYRGKGDLIGWLKVTATRLALRAQKREKQHLHADDALLDRLPDTGRDVELDILRAKYKVAFRDAFREALRNLADRDRTLIRQHHADRLSIDALAPIHGVHRATVARWIVAAERAVLDSTRARFRALLSASPAECESVMRLLGGELSMSLRWLA